MIPKRTLLAPLALAVLCLWPAASGVRAARARVASAHADTPTPAALLDQYRGGDFDTVIAALDDLSEHGDLERFYAAFEKAAPAWLDAGGVAERRKRELVAATFALEAARAGELRNWKLVRGFMGLDNIFWQAPPKFIEWGCALFRKDAVPRPEELTWQHAALGVAQRSEDFEFLIGSPFVARAEPKDEYNHLQHAIDRFPHDGRTLLAQGIALETLVFPDFRRIEEPKAETAENTQEMAEARAAAAKAADERQEMTMLVFRKLLDARDVGPEAHLRLGACYLRLGRADDALKEFDAVEQGTRDSFVVYLARLFKGQALEAKKDIPSAERAYRLALLAVPKAESASFALAVLLIRRDARADAARVIDAALTVHPRPVDPWRTYMQADDRFWPALVDQLRAEFRP